MSARIITTREADDLREHLTSRPDIWHAAAPDVFARATPDGYAAVYALRAIPGQPRLQGVVILPKAWSYTTCFDYLTWLLQKYTSYSERMRIEVILAGKLKEPTYSAAVAAEVQELFDGRTQDQDEKRDQQHRSDSAYLRRLLQRRTLSANVGDGREGHVRFAPAGGAPRIAHDDRSVAASDEYLRVLGGEADRRAADSTATC